MATYTVKIKLDNDAFKNGNEGLEVARILRALAAASEGAGVAYCRDGIVDVNGNTVAFAKISR